MILRVRGPLGQTTLKGIEPEGLVSDFLDALAANTGVPVGSLEVLAGFPPQPLVLPTDPSTATVASLGIQNGDSLTVRQVAGNAAAAPAPDAPPGAAAPGLSDFNIAGMSEDEQLARAIAASMDDTLPQAPAPSSIPPQVPAAPATFAQPPQKGPPLVKGEPAFEPISNSAGAVARRIVADDNSCLFSACGYVLQGTRAAAPALRSVVAEAVLSDPFEWNEAVLGKDPIDYAAWIKDPKRWGGAIELSILSKKFGKEIAAFDIQTQRVDIYGQGEGFNERVMVVYDGLHYDALAVAARVGASESQDVTALPASSSRTEAAMEAAARLVARFHSARQFTDTANFTLRCGVCKVGLRGEKEAVKHAETTGHTNFSEY